MWNDNAAYQRWYRNLPKMYEQVKPDLHNFIVIITMILWFSNGLIIIIVLLAPSQ